MNGILRQFSVARTPQQNKIAERRNRTLIEAARTMLADSKLPTTFWAEAINNVCYVQNRVLVIKPHNNTPYELFHGRTPALSFMKPFGCPITILNTLDHLGKFDGSEPDWLFDIDALTKTMNYKPIATQSNGFVGSECRDQEQDDNVNSTNNVNVASTNRVNAVNENTSNELPFDPDMLALEDISTFNLSSDHEDDDEEADMTNMGKTIQRFYNSNYKEVWTLVDLPNGKRAIGTKWVFKNKKDERGIVIRNKARLVAQGHTQEEWIDYDEVFAPVARIEAIRLFLDYASFKDIVVYQMDVKSAFLYEKIEEEVYVCQPPGFEDPNFPDKVYKVEKALYGLHQVPKAWYETLLTHLLDTGFYRGKIDKTLFIRRHKGDILLVQVYVDNIIFGLTKKELCNAFEKMMHEKFQMSSMGEHTFFLGLQVKQKQDEIFISQDKYVAEILQKYRFSEVKNASTPIETQKPLLKDKDGEEVDVHMYRSMIGSLMYLTSSRPDIMFVVCACARYQVNPKVLRFYAVKRIFKYLKGHLKLGLWYPKDLPFDLVAYTDSDYAGASLNRKSTIGGCQFLGCRLISWQCKKQTMVANSITKAEYMAALSCCRQFWAIVKAKTVNGEIQLQALVDGKKVIITEFTVKRDLQLEDTEDVDCLPNASIFEQLTLIGETPLFPKMMVQAQEEMGEGSAKPTNPHHTPTIIQPSTSQPQKTKQHRKPRRKVTEVPQPSDPTKHVTNEAINEEMNDSLVRATTTASSLEAEQDIGNIFKIQSKAIPNQSSSQGTDSGGGRRCQETMRYTIAQTRSEKVFKFSNDSLLVRVNTPRSDEDSLKLKELKELCTNLQKRVLDLENTKTTQALEIDSLKRRVKKLEKKQRSRTHNLKRLYKERISVINADEEITLVNDQDDEQMFDVDKDLHDEELNEEVALKLQAELQAGFKKKQRLANYQLAERLQVEGQQELNDEEKATLFTQLLEKKRKFFAVKRPKEKRNKPPTQAHQRKIMCTYLKNMEGKKLTDLKNKSFDSIQKIFDRAFKRVNTFVDYRIELVEESSKKAEAKVTKGSSKKDGEELE
nr:retrovirus-related Pol polyprotein from transposon TNT 1-94 [Tanacetum cinerariifolium]